MRLGPALASGIVGACALTLIHEAARHSIPHAPHVNVLGERAIRRIADALGSRPPGEMSLYAGALVGELVSNSLFYALSGLGGAKHATRTGALLGIAGGLGAVTLPEPLGLGRQPHRKTPATELMTLAWYGLGGLAAGAAYERLEAGAG